MFRFFPPLARVRPFKQFGRVLMSCYMRWIFGEADVGFGEGMCQAGGGAVPGTVRLSRFGACVRKKGTENPPDEAAVGERVGSWWQGADQAADPGETAEESPRTGRVHLARSGQETPSTRRRRSAGRDAGLERAPVRGLDGTGGGGGKNQWCEKSK